MTGATTKGWQWRTGLRQLALIMAGLLGALALLVLLGYQMLPLRQLHWSGVAVGMQQFRLAQLSFQAGQGEQWWDVRINELTIGWRGWPLQLLSAQQLQLAPVLIAKPAPAARHSALTRVDGEPIAAPTSTTPAELPLWPEVRIPAWLPIQTEIRQLLLQLPCQITRQQWCELVGSLLLTTNSPQHSLDLQLQGDGQQLQLQLDLIQQQQKLQSMVIRKLGLQLDIKALASAGWIGSLPPGLVPENIQLQLSGNWQADQLQLQLLSPFSVDFSYQTPQLTLPSAQLKLATGQLQCIDVRWQQCQLQLDAEATMQQLQHPLLKKADWQWRSKIAGTLNNLQLSGVVQNQQALQVSYQATLLPSAIEVNWQLAELFLLAGNPLQITSLWPELLELQRGKIAANGTLKLQLPAAALQHVRVKAQLKELYGVYDRTAFGGLSTHLLVEGDRQSFTLQLPELALKQLDHGFQAGPAQLSGRYAATWSAPAAGKVQLSKAQIGMFGGRLALAETQFNLQQPTIKLQLAVEKIQLAELLKQHPSAQMAGDGVLSGTIPLHFLQPITTAPVTQTLPLTASSKAEAAKSPLSSTANHQAIAQWQILGGSLSAEAPGGRLQYQYQPVAGKEPAGMDLAWQALSDFRYQTLATAVELQPNGKVLLQIKLHGYNPKLQQGRPVHFNINVEEDLPALLTSLQLSGQISDRVRQRIQQKIQQQQAAKPVPVKPQ